MLRAPRTNWLLLITVSVLVVTIVLRITAAFNPLWLDEIWSLSLSEGIQHPWDVFTIHHLNNHPLNTLYLWLLGYGRPVLAYRIPSLLSGVVLLLWMTYDAWKRSRLEGVFVAIFIGFSLPLLQTAAEARGYSPMLLAAYAAYVFYQRAEHDGNQSDRILYACFAALAIALHMSAITLIAAMAAGTFTRGMSLSLPEAIRRTLKCHAFPLIVFGVLVLGTLQGEAFGLGRDPGITFSHFVSIVFGWPQLPPFAAAIVAGISVVALLLVLERTWHRDPPQGIFLFALFFLAPAVLLLFGARALGLEVRFFLPGVAAFLLLCSGVCAWGWKRKSLGAKIAVLIFALLITAGQVQGIADLLRYGQSASRSLASTLTWIAEQSVAPITVGTKFTIDQELVDFYGNREIGAQIFSIVAHSAWSTTSPEWILERSSTWPALEEAFHTLVVSQYEIVKTAAAGEFWTVWRRKDL